MIKNGICKMQIENEHGFRRIAHLLSRYVAGVQTEKEERELYAWKGKEKDGSVFERLCEHVRERMDKEPEGGWEEAFARFERRRRHFQLKRRMKRWMSAAAVVAVGCTGVYFGWEHLQAHEGGEMELVAAVELEALEAAPMLSSGSGVITGRTSETFIPPPSWRCAWPSCAPSRGRRPSLRDRGPAPP